MNTKKHKHKNRPKPQPGSVEVKDRQEKCDVVEKIKEEVPKSEPITPEILLPQVETTKEEKVEEKPQTESITVIEDDNDESPAKPKRNKNKKKKQETEKTAEKEEPPKAQIKEEIKIEEPPLTEAVNLEVVEEFLEGVTPSARKKKNKKKTQDKPTEIKPIEEIKPLQKEEKQEDPVDVEVTELLLSTPEPAQEIKGKKKNKKKKRNDSERSDKSEDIKCTAAFEKFLADDTNPKEMEVKSTEVTETKNIIEVSPVESVKATILEETKETKLEETTEAQRDVTKGKQKNKKEKKQIPTEPSQQPVIEVPLEKTKTPIDLPEILSSSESKTDTEHSPKPKAKIAKPVEKKRKDNIEVAPPSEIISKSTEKLDIFQEMNIPASNVTSKEDTKTNLELKPRTDIEEQKSTETLDESKTMILGEKLKVPESNTMGKKRKKSPKPKFSKVEQLAEEAKIIKETSTSQFQLEPENIITVEDKLEPIITEKEIKVTKPDEAVKEKTKVEKEKTPIEMKTGIDDDIPPLTPITDDKFTETKSKKKKKTPKIPVQNDPKETEAAKTPEPIKEACVEVKEPVSSSSDDKAKCKEPELENKQLLLEDIEVRSVKTDESEGSTCDVIPDVHFVRSSSQQILDSNNNNMVINEIPSEEIRLNEPIAMPWIQGSGETPTPIPEIIPLSFDVKKETDKSLSKDENTDVKSKMMEVNKDMEELRLSIEKSLAEFSAMEKTEQESEKKIEKHSISKPLTEVKPKPIFSEQKPILQTQEIPIKEETKPTEQVREESDAKPETPPCPARKDKKGKAKKKGKQEATTTDSSTSTQSSSTAVETTDKSTEKSKEEKQEKGSNKSQSSDTKGKQQSDFMDTNKDNNKTSDSSKETNESNLIRKESVFSDSLEQLNYDPIDNFEDALTSSMDDVNRTFEIIAQDADTEKLNIQKEVSANKPEISVTAAEEDTKKTDKSEKVNPVSQPKNLLGHTDIPVPSNRTDYKKEKNKPPNERQAKVKIKDATDIEKKSTESQTESRIKNIEKSVKDSFSHVVKDNDDYVYKYSFRKVFLQSACHVCKKDLGQTRVPCGYCNLVFYCGAKHKDEDYPQHQALCFAVSTIVHLKDQKHIYADARSISGQDYRILRMQMILSCEKVLKRRLVPWEQEAMLYPRICADVACREWRQAKLKDCEGCGQLSYCSAEPDHLPKSHQRWCKSYSLYAKLVTYQQTKGRLEPRLPTKVFTKYEIPGKMNEVLAAMYEEKIDMTDIQYAALTQLATAPLTAAYYHQVYRDKRAPIRNTNGTYKKPFTIHVVGAELQFEADALNKWEIFFLHLRPDVDEMTVVLVSPALNPGNLPLDLLGKVRMCADCKVNDRRVSFSFQDKPYSEYRNSDVFINPDLICAFNPSIQRGSSCNLQQEWSATITSILKLKQPFIITAYTLPELRKDIVIIKELSDLNFSIITEPIFNNFASVRPDRNFITDDEIPLLFKNYCVSVICGY